jgi:hypothetical protein
VTGDANILHHVGLITRDLGTTIGQYERLGFSFTPVSRPRIPLRPGGEPEWFGAGNRTAVFAENYLEVLAIMDAALWATVTPQQRGPYDLDRPLARYEGLHVMHFGTDDLTAVHRRLRRDGVPCGDIRPFQRNVNTEAGPQTMRARAIGFPPQANPEALVQIAQHLTPELVFQKRYQQHDNGALRLVETTVCGENPAAYAATYTRYTGHESTRDGEVFSIDLGKSRVRVTSPECLPKLLPGAVPPAIPSLIGFTVTVADLDATRALLSNRGVAIGTVGNSLLVGAEDGAGATVSFIAD